MVLTDASDRGGTHGGVFAVGDFAIAKYLITNAQFERFVEDPTGYANPSWWGFSVQAMQWRQTREKAHGTAFSGVKAPRTRVSWFEKYGLLRMVIPVV